MMEYIDLFAYASELAVGLSSCYGDRRTGRSDLANFVDANNGFGYSYEVSASSLMIDKRSVCDIHDALGLWLRAYKQPPSVKIDLMLEAYDSKYPITCAMYREFISNRDVNGNTAYWQLLDYMLTELDKEITSLTESEMDAFTQRLGTALTLGAAKVFAEFAFIAIHKAKQTYSFASREQPSLVGEAYAVKDFAVMAYCVFNKEMWASQDMLRQAVNTKALAELWLFVALHLICALRSGDMERLPAPMLPYDKEITHQMILDGTFSRHDAIALADELVVRLKLNPVKPSKTSRFTGVPDIKLFVPESLKEPLGIIIAIATAHIAGLKAGDSFVKPCDSLYNMRLLFGERFVRAAGNRRFSSRRGNKSYMQGVDAIASYNDSYSKPKGYILAALARSHKGGVGSLPEITDIYLKDANFTGYKPEFIIREMFERGVFSFIPTILLEMYDGSSYKKLSVSTQTELICGLGLSAIQIEHIAESVGRSFSAARQTVAALLSDVADASSLRENTFGILQNIASGAAPGRQPEYLCLMTAANKTCPNSGRDSCLGCGYEIYTKSAMHLLMMEYVRLSTQGGADSWRCKRMVESAIMPAVIEMLTAMQSLYPDADDAGMLDIIERGLKYVDTSSKGTIQPRVKEYGHFGDR